jgi:Domain of unknown function (DUF6504)
MTRLYRASVAVERSSTGLPSSFIWRSRRRSIAAVLGQWRLVDAWWDPPGDADAPGGSGKSARDYYRVRTNDGLLCELYYDSVTGGWILDRVLD